MEYNFKYKLPYFNRILNIAEPLFKEFKKNLKKKDYQLSFIKEESISGNQAYEECLRFPQTKDKKYLPLHKITKYQLYKIIVNGITLNIHFYLPNEDFTNLINDLIDIVYLFTYKYAENKKLYQNYNLRFLLLDFPRKLSDSWDNLHKKGIFNNSSGLTNLLEKELIVTRLKGIKGLLIHELIHLYGLDYCLNQQKVIQYNLDNWTNQWEKLNIKKNSGIKSFIEGITNTKASLYLAVYLAAKKRSFKYFKYYIYQDWIHSIKNFKKLLKYWNLSYDEFLSPGNTYYQNALVLEYLYLKFLLYLYIPILFIDNNNSLSYQENLNQILFNKKNKKKYHQLLELEFNLNDDIEYFID
jgi:hypothetical protein